MSWLDSSFSFAKTAFSTAQKSIDRVLDIKEDKSGGEQNVKESDSLQEPGNVSYPSPLSWGAQASDTGAEEGEHAEGGAPAGGTEKPSDSKPASDSFSSTWGDTSSFWKGGPPGADTTETKTSTPLKTDTPARTKACHPASRKARSPRPAGNNTPSRTPQSGRTEDGNTRQTKPPSEEQVASSSLPITSTPVAVSTGDKIAGSSDTSVERSPRQHDSPSLPTSPITAVEDSLDSRQEESVDGEERREEGNGQRTSEASKGNDEVEADKMEEMLASCIAETDDQTSRQVDTQEHVQSEVLPVVTEDVASDNISSAAVKKDEMEKEFVSESTTLEVPLEGEKEKDHIEVESPILTPVPGSPPAVGDERDEHSMTVVAVQEKETMPADGDEDEDKGISSSDKPHSPDYSDNLENIRKELSRVSNVLEVRENRLIEMSKENMQLLETNEELQRQLSEAQETLKMSSSDVEGMREEFAKRLSSTEKKLQAVIKERDSFKKQLQAVEEEYSQQKKSSEHELRELLREKEEQVTGLMEEGEKLSKQQLTSNNIIKKLRGKEKQSDQLNNSLKQQIENLESEVKRLKEVIKKREENEHKYQETLSQLNSIAEQQTKDLSSIKPERDELLEKVRSLQSNLDSAYRELTELRKANALTQSAAQVAALGAEKTAKEELRELLLQQQLEAQQEKDRLVLQVNDLRMSLQRSEQQSAWREEQLRQEIAEQQQRMQESESRNQDLSSTISDATKPLLRQIESLQAAHSAQSSNWERVETTLTHRLVDAQTQLTAAVEAERGAVEREMMLQGRTNLLESQLTSLRQERSQLTAAVEMERTKLLTIEDGHQREIARLETVRSHLTQTLDEVKKEKGLLERQLEYERVRLEAESKKATLEYQEKERLRNQLAHSISRSSPPPSPFTRTASVSSSHGYGDIPGLDRSISQDGSDTDGLVYNRTSIGSAVVLERLQSLLKQKEGELANVQSLVSTLERSRAAMTEELAKLASANEELKLQAESVDPLKNRLVEVQQKYEAMLQMYGEKAEETEELKLDIQDLKTMYRQQIEDLLTRKS